MRVCSVMIQVPQTGDGLRGPSLGGFAVLPTKSSRQLRSDPLCCRLFFALFRTVHRESARRAPERRRGMEAGLFLRRFPDAGPLRVSRRGKALFALCLKESLRGTDRPADRRPGRRLRFLPRRRPPGRVWPGNCRSSPLRGTTSGPPGDPAPCPGR